MSASSKKKLRNAQQAEKMTEKQLTEQKEAKKLKLYTTLAVVILAALVLFAAYIGISKTITNSGIRERNTVALTIGEEKISNAELNYFFIDAVNTFYSQYGSYAYLLGLDTTTPLDEQIINEETKETWADDFINTAVANAKAVYALVDDAKANGYTLPEADKASIETEMSTLALYATLYGYPDAESYMKAIYGNGTTEKTLREYREMLALAASYQEHFTSTRNYTEDELRAAEAENFNKYSSYNYDYYYMSVNSFAESTESKEQMDVALMKAEDAAKSLTENITTVEELDAAIAALSINEGKEAGSYASRDISYSNLISTCADWISDSSRKNGDITYLPSVSTSTDENGNPVETISGFYVVRFDSCNDNTFALANVRHILVEFEGGSYDSTTGVTTYNDEEKAAAKAAAEEIYNEWKNGAATEDSFAALANEKSDDGDGTTGGLFTDVYPGRTVDAFEEWCFGGHKAGDTGIIETEYGYHVMFYSGDSETTYRDYLITSDLTTNDYNAWYTALVEAVTATVQNTKFLNTGLVLGG